MPIPEPRKTLIVEISLKMISPLKEKDTAVYVLAAKSPVRMLLQKLVKNAGFQNVTSCKSIDDFLNKLTVGRAWVISPFFSDQPKNLMKILQLISEQNRLKFVRVSVTYEENEAKFLPRAFSLGLLSCHPSPFTKKSMQEGFEDLLSISEQCQWQDPTIAAEYLRKVLLKESMFEELYELERNLAAHYPGNTDLLFKQIDPLIKLGQLEDLETLLSQILVLDPKAEDQVNKIFNEHFPDKSPLTKNSAGSLSFLGLQSAMVVDNDSAASKRSSDVLKELGIENIHIFDNGEEALEHFTKDKNIDVVIHEWRIPKLSGPLFLQKAKSALGGKGVFIVCSSLVKKSDLPLMREMGVSSLVGKPVEKPKLIDAVINSVQQHRNPTEKGSLERKIREMLAAGDLDQAEILRTEYAKIKGVPSGMLNLIDAEFAFEKGEFEQAKALSISSIKSTGDSIIALSILGKTLMQLREFDSALKCFEKAKNLSPQNVDRLCTIAEVQSEIGNEEAASEAIEKVKNIDQKNSRIAAAEARVALNTGDYDKAQSMMDNKEVLDNVVSYMNNQAVAMSRCNQLKKSINQYKKTLKAIPADSTQTQAIVRYNLALAMVKADDLKSAVKVLQNCTKVESKVKTKALALTKKLRMALKMGKKVKMAQSNNRKPKQDLFGMMELKPGDLSCYLIYGPKRELDGGDLLKGESIIWEGTEKSA